MLTTALCVEFCSVGSADNRIAYSVKDLRRDEYRTIALTWYKMPFMEVYIAGYGSRKMFFVEDIDEDTATTADRGDDQPDPLRIFRCRGKKITP